jgi:hypothetical protein
MAEPQDTQALIRAHQRRLQKLKAQQAVKGVNTPPEVLIEIEDIEAELARLQQELAGEQEQLQQTLTATGGLASPVAAQIRPPIEARLAEIEHLLHELVADRAGGYDQTGQTVGSQINVAGNLIQAGGPDPAVTLAEQRARYLRQLSRVCQILPLAALGAEEGVGEELSLDQVYIALDTTTPQKKSATTKPGQAEAARPLPALAAAQAHPRLVLLGEPGAGKSTFIRQLLGQLARAGLGEAGSPAGLAADLLPLLLTLRDLAPRLAAIEVESGCRPRRNATACSRRCRPNSRPI